MSLRTFSITTLGCRVNHYESEQLATLLRSRGLSQAPADRADVRIVHTCSVTVEAASKSRQNVRRMTRLPMLIQSSIPNDVPGTSESGRARVIVTGCWATSDPDEAARMQGVDAVLGHHCDVQAELSRLLSVWEAGDREGRERPTSLSQDTSSALPATDGARPTTTSASPEPEGNEGWIKAGTPAGPNVTTHIKPFALKVVKRKLEDDEKNGGRRGMVTLPLLGQRQSAHQRAFLKVQDGCDAHCTYCIIPQLRPRLWSKPVDDAVEEARRLVGAGHLEIVLTGIFLGAYGQRTALRRRQSGAGALGELIEALCTRVEGLRRVRLSSMEPLDVTPGLIEILRGHSQVVPHFHLPLQSGSDVLLRRMNRQYGREDYLRMVEQLRAAFDRPALTTDIIVGFPRESEAEFERTIEVVERAGFIHVHAFSFSPRPGTAAARWTRDFVRGPVVNQRIERLRELSAAQSLEYRRGFLGEEVEVMVERDEALAGYQHGRCERYFAVHFGDAGLAPGSAARVRVERVTGTHTFGRLS
jgi:MiaB/RimO family radical SAM methylthiotransferase